MRRFASAVANRCISSLFLGLRESRCQTCAQPQRIDAHDIRLFQEADGRRHTLVVGLLAGGEQCVSGQGGKPSKGVALHLLMVVPVPHAMVGQFPSPVGLLLRVNVRDGLLDRRVDRLGGDFCDGVFFCLFWYRTFSPRFLFLRCGSLRVGDRRLRGVGGEHRGSDRTDENQCNRQGQKKVGGDIPRLG